MTFKPIDAKRDEFRKYLERTGVLEAITKAFMELLQIEPTERPENAIEFLYTNLGASKELSDTLERTRQELEDGRNEIARLKRALQKLENEKQKKSDNDGSSGGGGGVGAAGDDGETTIATTSSSTRNDEQTNSKTNQQNKEIIDKSDDDITDNAVDTGESSTKNKIAGENNEKDSKSESTEKTETVTEEKN